MNLILRLGNLADADRIADFNTAMALETEALRLRPERVSAGVRHLITHPESGFYLVAELDDSIVGSLLVTTEWSDWRNGLFWWIQSVYVQADSRQRGVYKALYAKVKSLAAATPKVCGFRLYVEQDNRCAQETYRRLGMNETHYRIFEELKELPPGQSYFQDSEIASGATRSSDP
jgi:ribosomal protein S18 acetylase RimI-like enzyme